MHSILTINPGSTSTKIALFHDLKNVLTENIVHDPQTLNRFPRIVDQLGFRLQQIQETLKANAINLQDLSIVMGRGGLLRPLQSGVYAVNAEMIAELTQDTFEEHASNLGALIAEKIAHQVPCKAYIADPVVVDEMEDIARITGLPDILKESRFHALNHKAVARRAANDLGKQIFDVNLVIAHIGGGISVASHRKGRVVDVNEALYGDGPFSVERTGKLSTGAMLKLCFSENASMESIKKRLVGNGGFVAHFGTNDAREIEKRIAQGDERAKLVYDAMAYQIAKEIGAFSVVLKGQIDAIVLTGGVAHSSMLTRTIKAYVSFLAPVFIYPGEDELRALAEAGYAVLQDEIVPKTYPF